MKERKMKEWKKETEKKLCEIGRKFCHVNIVKNK